MQSTINYSISPYLLDNTKTEWSAFEKLLEKKTSLSLQYKEHKSTRSFKKHLGDDGLDLVYADAYHASILLRNHGYLPVARALGQYDEALVVVQADSNLMDIRDLQPQMYLSITVNPTSRLLGRILLQPADISEDDMVCRYHRSQISVVRDLIMDKTDAGVMSSTHFDRMQPKIRSRLRILVRSQAYQFSALWMLSPKNMEKYPALVRTFGRMHKNRAGSRILQTLNTLSWLRVERIKVEEMADLMNMLR